MTVRFSICLPWRHLRGGGTVPLIHKFCITWGEWSASPRDKKFGGFQLRYGYYREEKQSCSCWKLSNISTVLRFVITVQTMLYRSWFGHNTDCEIPMVFWSQYRLWYTFRLVVAIPTMLYLSCSGHNTDYAIRFVFWSQYRLRYTVRLVVAMPTTLYLSRFGHNTVYVLPIPCSTANLKSMRTLRKVQVKTLSSSTLSDSASLNVLPCSSYQWCHSSHCVAATDMVINARVAEDA